LSLRFLNRRYHRVVTGPIYHGGVHIFEEDWDNLVILDACRYDLFQSTVQMDGALSCRRSLGSNTVQFLKANLSGRNLSDTVYVAANPQIRKIGDGLDVRLHDVVDLWDHGWDDVMNTVLPETTTEKALEAAAKNPDKRLVIHYNQPHVPFIGEVGREHFDLEKIGEHPLPFWEQPMTGAWPIDDETIWAAYRENLELTIPHVERLLARLTGRSVVTADHGNFVGERSSPIPVREYGHPYGIFTTELLDVPWLVVDDGTRRKVTPGTSSSLEDRDQNDVKERLAHLGYR
jgi:hypothetical protein